MEPLTIFLQVRKRVQDGINSINGSGVGILGKCVETAFYVCRELKDFWESCGGRLARRCTVSRQHQPYGRWLTFVVNHTCLYKGNVIIVS